MLSTCIKTVQVCFYYIISVIKCYLLVSEEAAKETGDFVWMEDPLCWFHGIYNMYNFCDNLKLII